MGPKHWHARKTYQKRNRYGYRWQDMQIDKNRGRRKASERMNFSQKAFHKNCTSILPASFSVTDTLRK